MLVETALRLKTKKSKNASVKAGTAYCSRPGRVLGLPQPPWLVGVWRGRERELSRLNRGEKWPALVNYKVEFQKLRVLRKERKLPEAIPTYHHHHHHHL